MDNPPSPSAVERIAGNLVTEGALTYIAAMAGTPLAALLPVLGTSLASKRQQTRVQETLEQIDCLLQKNIEAVQRLSDAQYLLINESIVSLLQTCSAEKIDYLRRAISSSLTIEDIQPQEAVVLARTLRDISAQEADFLIKNFKYRRIHVAPPNANNTDTTMLTVDPGSPEALIVSGLVSLGLVTSAGPTYGDQGLLGFSPVVAKLLVLLRGDAA